MADISECGWTGYDRKTDHRVSPVQSLLQRNLSAVPEHGKGDGDVFKGITGTGPEYSAVYDR